MCHVELVPRGAAGNPDEYRTTSPDQVDDQADGAGRVFAGVSLNPAKCEQIWARHPNNVVVRIQGADDYGTIVEPRGWGRVKDEDLDATATAGPGVEVDG